MKHWKRGFAYAGFGVAVLTVLTGRPELAWAAIVLLALALGLRLRERARERRAASARDTLSEGRDA
jgi:uncharacterized membrane protein